MMNGVNRINHLEFHDQLASNQEIETSFPHHHPLIGDLHFRLPKEIDPPQTHLHCQSFLIHPFQTCGGGARPSPGALGRQAAPLLSPHRRLQGLGIGRLLLDESKAHQHPQPIGFKGKIFRKTSEEEDPVGSRIPDSRELLQRPAGLGKGEGSWPEGRYSFPTLSPPALHFLPGPRGKDPRSLSVKAVVQRVRWGEVRVEGEVVGRIDRGMVVLLGVGAADTSLDGAWIASKIAKLRIFPDAQGKMGRSVAEVGGALLLVSQFTLLGDCHKGNRPSFTAAAPPSLAEGLYEEVRARWMTEGIPVATGRFGAMMEVNLGGDGPVTLLLDSRGSSS